MADNFWIQEMQTDPPVAVVKVGGRLGANPAKELRCRCTELRDRGCRHLVLDLSEVTFVSSSGVGALIVLNGESSISGGTTQLVDLSEPVRRTIELLNLAQFLTIVTDREAALRNIEINA